MPAPDLSINKILATAGAGATSAVLGSLFGVAGTVLGAAVGAVLSTIAASLYQRSLDRARHSLTTRISIGQKTDPEATVVMPPPVLADDARTELIAPAVSPRTSRRRIVGYVVATVLGFALALGAVTGIEAIKGSTLVTGQEGTSVGRVITGGGDAESATPTETPTATPTPDASNSDGDNDHHRTSDDSDSGSSSASRTAKPTSSATPSSSAGPGSSGGILPILPSGSNTSSNQ